MKKFLKFIVLIALPMLAVVSCEEKDEFSELLQNDLYNLEKESIKVSADQKSLTFNSSSHFAELQFESNYWWKLDTVLVSTVNPEIEPLEKNGWFTITPTDNFGKRPVTITLTRNIEKSNRKVLLKFSSEDGKEVRTLELIQEASVPFLEIEPNRLDFSLLTNILTVDLSTTENWTVETPDWCNALLVSGTKCKDNLLVISILKNSTKAERKGIVKFTAGSITKEFEIIQGGTFEKPTNVVVRNSDKLEVQWSRSTGAISYKLNYYEPGTDNLIDTCTVTFASSYPELIVFDISRITTWKGYVGTVDVSVSATLGQNLWEESNERIRMNTHFGESESSDGSKENPFVVKTPRHFLNISKKLNASFIQEADLDLSTITNYVPITNYSGMYDGRNHKISNLTLNPVVNTPYGIFGIINGVDAGVKNLILDACTIKVEQAVFPNEVGLLAGRLVDGTIENCEVRNYSFTTTRISNVGVGGLLGFNNRGKVLNNRMYSGIISSAVLNPLTGLIQSARNQTIGGIVGRNGANNTTDTQSVIEQCINYDMKVVGGNTQVGGIAGQNNSVIRSTINYATIRASQHIGGITGGSTSTDNTAYGSLIEDCANFGEISIENGTAHAQAGGIIGRGVGGVFAGKTSTIRRCFNAGNISYKSQAGTSTPTTIGGFAATLRAYIVNDCYNVGNVSSVIGGGETANFGGVNLGGFVGNLEGATYTNCYSTGTVSGSNFYNGLFAGRKVGLPSNAISCYVLMRAGSPIFGFVASTTISETSPEPIGLTEVQMKDAASFVGFDFGGVWQLNASINNGFPSLQTINYSAAVKKRAKK